LNCGRKCRNCLMGKQILVIAPHADDEVLGCGGTIARHAASGDQVHVLVVTQGAPELFSSAVMRQIHEEMRAAHELLGVHSTQILDFPAPKLDIVPGYEIANAVGKVIRDIEPKVVYLPHRGDLHADHAKVHAAALVAARPVNGCSVNQLLCYETLSETDWGIPSGENAFVPTVFVNISDFLEQKLKAMQCYRSQLKSFPDTRSLESLRALARLRGGTVSVDAAESFMLIRQVEK
jgi:LmbE family N-acetylglucosaminyl deacetylase